MLITALLFLPSNVFPLLRLRVTHYLREAVARPFLASATFVAICYFILRGKQPQNLWIFAYTVAWQSALFAIVAYAFGISPSDREAISEKFRQFASTGFRWRARPAIPAQFGVEQQAEKWSNR
jgi:hypothetical protein